VSAPSARLAAFTGSLLLIGALALCWWGGLDRSAGERTHAALQRALVTFALTRTLNGVISVAQGTELAFQPAGVGIILTPGQILDPLNDLIEQFSSLTLLAASSLGLQILLGEMLATEAVNVALTVVAVFGVALLWWRPSSPRWLRVRSAWLRLTAAFVFLRFAIALATLASGLVSEYFLAPRESAAVAVLSRTQSEIEAAGNEASAPSGTTPDSVLQRFNRFLDDQRQALDLERRLADLKANVERAVAEVVNLIALYVIETLLLPLGFLVVGWGVLRQAWQRIL
jgi:hypothetical protein